MRGVGKEAILIAAKRKEFIDKAFMLFSQKNIDTVSLQDIVNETDYGIATLYRYFTNKQTLVVEVATCKWEEYLKANQTHRPSVDFSGMNAADIFDFYLESFLELYRNHKDLLRFNQFFNIYIKVENIDTEVMKPYGAIIEQLRLLFHKMYLKGTEDRTLKCEISEEEMFSTSLHLMLAAVTRYAIGLAYIPENGFDPEEELRKQKEAIKYLFTADNKENE